MFPPSKVTCNVHIEFPEVNLQLSAASLPGMLLLYLQALKLLSALSSCRLR